MGAPVRQYAGTFLGMKKKIACFLAVFGITAIFLVAPCVSAASADEVSEYTYVGTPVPLSPLFWSIRWYSEELEEVPDVSPAWQGMVPMQLKIKTDYVSNDVGEEFGVDLDYYADINQPTTENADEYFSPLISMPFLFSKAETTGYVWYRSLTYRQSPWYRRYNTILNGRVSVVGWSEYVDIYDYLAVSIPSSNTDTPNLTSLSSITWEYNAYGTHTEEQSLRDKFNLPSNPLFLLYITYTDTFGNSISFAIPSSGSAIYSRTILIDESGAAIQEFNRGKQEGYSEGVADGQQSGYETGYTVGYSEGSRLAIEDTPFIEWVGALFGAVIDIFNIQIFGIISIGDILLLVLLFSVLSMILKLIRG